MHRTRSILPLYADLCFNIPSTRNSLALIDWQLFLISLHRHLFVYYLALRARCLSEVSIRMSATITSSSSAASLKVLSMQTIQILHARGEAGLQGGYRAVSNTSYATADSLDFEATVLIPDEINSIETLRFSSSMRRQL